MYKLHVLMHAAAPDGGAASSRVVVQLSFDHGGGPSLGSQFTYNLGSDWQDGTSDVETLAPDGGTSSWTLNPEVYLQDGGCVIINYAFVEPL
jgi:hypothetical protein